LVGRTPSSAAGPPAGFRGCGKGLILQEENGSRGTRADQGVRPTKVGRFGKSQVSSASGGARIVQSVTKERHAALDLGQSIFAVQADVENKRVGLVSQARRATAHTFRMVQFEATQREQESRWRPHNGNR